MPSHVLFLLHGIGQRAPAGASDKPKAAAEEWPRSAIALLTALARKYAPQVEVSTDPATPGVRIVPLSYCELIVRQIETWDAFGASDVAHTVSSRFPTFAGGLTGLSEISATDAPFFWNGPVDLLFYRLFFDRDIRTHVRRQIATALDPGPGGAMVSCSFICHSMGTSVLHDTLNELLTDPQAFTGFVSMNVRLYASVANVSRVMRSISDPHTSAVRPIGAPGPQDPRASVRKFVNVHHFADPVAHLGMFRPDWPTNQRFYTDVVIDKLKYFDVHGLIRYLEHPSVHIPILETVTGVEIDAQKRRLALEEYDAGPGDDCPVALEALRVDADRLRQLWDARASKTPVDFAVTMVEAWKHFTAAREACGGGG